MGARGRDLAREAFRGCGTPYLDECVGAVGKARAGKRGGPSSAGFERARGRAVACALWGNAGHGVWRVPAVGGRTRSQLHAQDTRESRVAPRLRVQRDDSSSRGETLGWGSRGCAAGSYTCTVWMVLRCDGLRPRVKCCQEA